MSTNPNPAARDATQLLMNDHREVKAMFQQFKKLAEEDGSDDEKMLLAEQICVALTVHTQLEEELLYPAARELLTDDEDVIDEAYVEHMGAKELIAKIKDAAPDSPLYDAKVTVLGEYIDHHVNEEETELFPKLRKTSLDLAELGERLAQRKTELMSQTSETVSGAQA
jgi:hemerythrin superfamily protein